MFLELQAVSSTFMTFMKPSNRRFPNKYLIQHQPVRNWPAPGPATCQPSPCPARPAGMKAAFGDRSLWMTLWRDCGASLLPSWQDSYCCWVLCPVCTAGKLSVLIETNLLPIRRAQYCMCFNLLSAVPTNSCVWHVYWWFVPFRDILAASQSSSISSFWALPLFSILQMTVMYQNMYCSVKSFNLYIKKINEQHTSYTVTSILQLEYFQSASLRCSVFYYFVQLSLCNLWLFL